MGLTLPVDWRSSTLGAEVDVLTGFPFPSSGYSSDGVRLVRGSNVKRGRLDWDKSITEFWPGISGEIFRYELRNGDLVIAMDGALVGRSFATIQQSDLPCLLLQRVARLRSSKVEQKLLAEWVGSVAFERHVDSLKTQTAIPHISPADIRSFPVLAPTSRKEQRAIVAALSDVDALIGALDKLIAKKRDLKQAAMQQLLTGQTRLPGFSGEWEAKLLRELFTFSGGLSASRDQLSDAGYCYLHYGDIHLSAKSVIDVDAEFLAIPKLNVRLGDVNASALLNDGDIVFVDASEDDDGTSKHVVVVNPNNRPYISGLHTIVAKSKSSDLQNTFKRYCFQTRHIKDQFRFYAVGTKVSGISKTSIAKIELRYPKSLEEQTAIATVLSDMDAELAALEARREKTRALKQGMMQELLTGRIRLV